MVLVGECKWTNEWLKIGALNDLRGKVTVMSAGSSLRFARCFRWCFAPSLTELAQAEGILL